MDEHDERLHLATGDFAAGMHTQFTTLIALSEKHVGLVKEKRALADRLAAENDPVWKELAKEDAESFMSRSFVECFMMMAPDDRALCFAFGVWVGESLKDSDRSCFDIVSRGLAEMKES